MAATTAARTATPYAYRQCAARARDLADILRARLDGHPHRSELLVFIGHLHTAAEGFETAEPLVMDGVTIPNVTPSEGHLPLLMAVTHAADHPEAGISEAVFAYVTAPVTRRTYRLEPQASGGREDAELRTRIALAEHDLATEGDPTTRYALLATLVQLHGDHLARGGEVAA
ncbi:hypothetical protein [Streptomyces sp. OK228]|uniref:hypothetical protein n=1 Tax=Streptomyces sp. OK228 TaxID=1882786 RepID=UPI000BC80451|nr:hypothetical protein [Streptomyces sp. OK228]SOE31756.1 hypothetical protein SAMN05442782_8689 [Streptomyces sp. OK228]